MRLKALEIRFIGDHLFTLNLPIKTLPCTNVCVVMANMFGIVSALFGNRTLSQLLLCAHTYHCPYGVFDFDPF